MSDNLEAVLRRVASGELTPEQALRLLDGAAPEAVAAPVTTVPPVTSMPEPSVPSIRGIKVQSSYRSLEIVADPQVTEAHVNGEHSVRIENGVMIVTTPGPLDDDTDGPLFSFSALPRTLNWIRTFRDRQVRIRVNPSLPVELELTGVELSLTGVAGGLTGKVSASAVKLDKVEGRIELQTFSSSCKGNLVVREDSQLTCESSSVRLSLAGGSDVRVEATGRMGRLNLPEDAVRTGDGETSRFTVGSGAHLLTVDSVMSSVTIDVPSWAASA